MGIAVQTLTQIPVERRVRHPNEFDRRRIERALRERKRYRYVSPSVLAVASGYRIVSPCCSRNIDADGGVIDVALLQYCDDVDQWDLYRKNHSLNNWEVQKRYTRLTELLDGLREDPDRQFWQ
jgi:hypothetical protein